MDTRRTILLVIFAFSVVMLWEGWQRQHAVPTPEAAVETQAQGTAAAPVPTVSQNSLQPPAETAHATPVASSAPKLIVQTDLLKAEISAEGGDITHLELLTHRSTEDRTKNFLLLDSGEQHIYVAQSGLIGDGLPNHKTLYQLPAGNVEMAPGQDTVQVRLEAPVVNGVKVTKILTFHRGQYLIDSSFEIKNESGTDIAPNAYFQLLRDDKPATSGRKGISSFTGPALYTAEGKFQKLKFTDIADGKVKLPTAATNGWIAMVQHYFVSAWLPQGDVKREFFARKVGGDLFTAGVVVPVQSIAPGKSGTVTMELYSGPQEQNKLEKIAPGLELVVDYGWLTVVAAPIFWLLEFIHKFIGNWGWSIILLTLLIKLAFFPLSATSYKSMAKMRQLTPRLARLKEQYGDDRAKLNQEMMELYRREKINPLGGCLPIVIQIPVFIALYWVLAGSVEMRDTPWIGWIHDLSSKDPYFVLPLIMGVTMLVQTKLNPSPPDPMQAKIMMLMPVVFTAMFLFFPAGLVLYWITNNLLSIAQQWQINRMIEGGKKTT